MDTTPSIHPRLLTRLAPLIILAFSGDLASQDWPNWRGPNHNGSTTAQGLPAKFTQKKHVRWATDMPGPGASTPIVIGKRIFLTSVDTERDRLVALCVDRTNGEVMWKRDAGSGYVAGRGSRTGGRLANYASPSAATDGERVVFFFGNGDLVGYDYEGEELWRRNIQTDYGKFAFQWTFSASPTVFHGKVYLPVLQRNVPVGRGRRGNTDGASIDSFLLAMDPNTGKTVFKHERPSPARMESLESYATIVPCSGKKNRNELLVVGGDVLTGHDPDTGRELWRWGTWNRGHNQRAWRLVPSVVVGNGVALVCAPKRAPVYAVQLGGNGDLGDKAKLWHSERRSPLSSDVPTPAFHDGYFYVLNDNSPAISKVRAKDGEIAWSRPLAREFKWRASPTVSDGKVFCMNHNGEVAVVDAANGKVLHHAFMGGDEDDQIRASVVVAHNNLFIRTNEKLFCIAGDE